MALITPIVPAETTAPAVEAQQVYVNVSFGEGEQYANGLVNLFDENGNIVQSAVVTYTEEELADWGTDDEYVLTLSLQKLGYQPV
jgi:hypothetical protein